MRNMSIRKEIQNERWEEYYKHLKKGIDEGTATLHQAQFDLRNIGMSYDVLRVRIKILHRKTYLSRSDSKDNANWNDMSRVGLNRIYR